MQKRKSMIIEDPNLFNEHIDRGTPTFVLFYWSSCGPCKATKPEWKKLDSVFRGQSPNDFVIAQIEKDVIPNVRDKNGQAFEINGFPTIMYISSDGTKENYDGAERTVDSFKEWIESKVPVSQKGKPRRRTIRGGSRRSSHRSSRRRSSRRHRHTRKRYHK